MNSTGRECLSEMAVERSSYRQGTDMGCTVKTAWRSSCQRDSGRGCTLSLSGNTGYFRFRLRSFLTAIVLAAGLFHGCDKGVFFRSSPEVTIETALTPFGEISINSIFQIELRTEPDFSISLTGPETILENISYEVTGDVLEVSDGNSWQWMPDYPVVRLVITFPDLERININSASSIYSRDTLDVADLSVIAMAQLIEFDLIVNAGQVYLRTGTDNYGHYTFRGKTDHLNLQVFGSAQVWAEDLIAETARVRNLSIADCHVYARDELRVWLGHYGNIYYYSSPEEIIIESMDSRGRLIQRYPD